jgi:hypothetical protein
MGSFPYTSQHSNCYIIVAIRLDAIYIFNEPMKKKDGRGNDGGISENSE